MYYPLVGLLIGLLLTVSAYWLQEQPSFVVAAILLATWVGMTGALHLDGLADCADAWVGGFGDKQRTLTIMKDPASGPMAVCALVLTLLLKWSALTALLDTHRLWALLLVPVLGRTAMMGLMLTSVYITPQGLGSALLQHLPRTPAWCVVALTGLGLALTLGSASLIAAMLVTGLIRRASIQRLDGVTGDVYGATLELSETAALLVLAL